MGARLSGNGLVPLMNCASAAEAILAGTPQFNHITLLTLRPSQFRWKIWVQVLICIVHPLPYGHVLLDGWYSEKVALLMFLRLHLVFRVIRDYSEIWLNRRSIKKLAPFVNKIPDFNWSVSTCLCVYAQRDQMSTMPLTT